VGAAPALKEMSQHPFCKNFSATQKETVMKLTRFNESASTNVCTSMKLDLKCEAGPIRSGKTYQSPYLSYNIDSTSRLVTQVF